MIKPNEISDILKQQLEEVDTKIDFEEVGTVLEVGDGVAHVFGLDNVRSSELIEFENGVRGVAMNLEESNVGVILIFFTTLAQYLEQRFVFSTETFT